ncbi:unnamed protein product [Chrysoparadoxa australica]
MTGEDWNVVMYDAIRTSGWGSVAYFVSCVVIGRYFLLSLLMAIILTNFREDLQGQSLKNATIKAVQLGRRVLDSPRQLELQMEKGLKKFWMASSQRGKVAPQPLSQPHPKEQNPGLEATGSVPEIMPLSAAANEVVPSLSTKPLDATASPTPPMSPAFSGDVDKTLADSSEPGVDDIPADNSTPRRIRLIKALNSKVLGVSESKWFELASFLFIVLSSIMLVFEKPTLDPASQLATALDAVDWVTSMGFLVELCIRLHAHTLRHSFKSYWRDGFNVLDTATLLVCLFSLAVPYGESFSGVRGLRSLRNIRSARAIRTLRALRALRPLRLIHRTPGLKRIVDTLVAALPSVVDVAVVLLLIYFVFSALCVYLFRGSFYACNTSASSDPSLGALIEATYGLTQETFKQKLYKEDCEALGAAWELELPHQHFNSFGAGLLTLFGVSTLEGWAPVMFASIDATGIDSAMVRDWAPRRAFLYFLFLFCGNFFAINLFAGAIVKQYRRLEFSLLVTPRQKRWIDTTTLMVRARLRPATRCPDHPLRRRAYMWDKNEHFDTLVGAALTVYIGFAVLRHVGQPNWFNIMADASTATFLVVLALKVLLKVLAFGPSWVWDNGWNTLDVVLVLLGPLAYLLEELIGLQVGPLVTVARASRVVLVMRQLQAAKGLERLIETLVRHVPGVVNISALLFLVLFCFAAMGVQLFGTVVLQSELNHHANFQSFGLAIMTLFRISTGEGWTDLMSDCLIEPGNSDPAACITNPSYAEMSQAWEDAGTTSAMIGCGPGETLTITFYLTFILMSSFIVLHLFVALLVDAFNDTTWNSPLSPEHFKHFCEVWGKYDKDAKYLMPFTDFVQFLKDMEPPLGLKGLCPTRTEVRQMLQSLELNDFNGCVYFHEVCIAMGRRALQLEELESAGAGAGDSADLIEEHYWDDRRLRRIADKIRPLKTGINTGQHLAAVSIQSRWRAVVRERSAKARPGHRFSNVTVRAKEVRASGKGLCLSPSRSPSRKLMSSPKNTASFRGNHGSLNEACCEEGGKSVKTES